MVKLTVKLACVVLLMVYLSATACAEPISDYKEASKVYLEAAACMAAYSDNYGRTALSALKERGWNIQYFHVQQKLADAKFVFMKKVEPDTKQVTYLLAIAGTEDDKDIRVGLKVGKVYFAGSTVDEFAANADKKNVDNSFPKVHRGFHQVVQNALDGPGGST